MDIDNYSDYLSKRGHVKKKFKRTYGKCALCNKFRLLDNHGKTTKGKSIYEHDKTIIKVCRYCHTDIHSLSNDKFYIKYKLEKSKYIHERNWI